MNIIPQIKTVIKKLIMRQYPELTEFEVRDLFADDNIESWLGNNYVVDFYTSECLTSKKQMEIDTEVKTLFKMLELPILAGISRKSMIYKTLNSTPEFALNGTTVLNTIAVQKGANILRVHDVKEAVECINLLVQL